MAILDVVLGNVPGLRLGKGLEPEVHRKGLVHGLLGMLISGHAGGLSKLLGHLTSAGFGEAVGSWVSTGTNQPVMGQQLQAALPADVLANLAATAGLDCGQASHGLAEILPAIVDQLSPNGVLPRDSELQSALAGLSRMFFGTG